MLIKNKKGFSLIELIIAVGAFAVLASGVFGVIIGNYKNFYGTGNKQYVSEFAQEGIEAVKAIRDNSWQDIEDKVENLDFSVSNGVAKNSDGFWEFNGTSTISGDLTRLVFIRKVKRNSNGEIVDWNDTGEIDSSTMLIESRVIGEIISPFVLTEYITNWDYKTIEQSTWSAGAGREFFDGTGYHTSINIVPVGQRLKLLLNQPTVKHDWRDLGIDATTETGRSPRDMDFGFGDVPAEKPLAFVVANAMAGLWAYDIDGARSGQIERLWVKDFRPFGLGDGHSIAINPSPRYKAAYVGHIAADGRRAISVHNLGGLNPGNSQPTDLEDIGRDDIIVTDLITNKNGSLLFATTSNGTVLIYNISSRDEGLRISLSGVWERYLTSDDVINKAYLSEDETKLYIVNDSSRQFIILDVRDHRNIRVLNFLSDRDCPLCDYNYITKIPDASLFLVTTEDSRGELKVIEVDINNRPTIYGRYDSRVDDLFLPVVYDPDHQKAIMVGTHGNIGVLERGNHWQEPRLFLADAEGSPIEYHGLEYHTGYNGIFLLNTGRQRLEFLKKDDQTATYAASGVLISSIIDLGATNQELHNVKITQQVPDGCNIDVTFMTATTTNFNLTDQEEYDTDDDYQFDYEYEEDIDPDLNGQRFLRYKVEMSACGIGNIRSPALSSVKFNYE